MRIAAPDEIVAGLAWGWPHGRLRLAFPDAADEDRRLLSLADWVDADADHIAQLAEYMLDIERQTGSTWRPQYRASDRRLSRRASVRWFRRRRAKQL